MLVRTSLRFTAETIAVRRSTESTGSSAEILGETRTTAFHDTSLYKIGVNGLNLSSKNGTYATHLYDSSETVPSSEESCDASEVDGWASSSCA